MAAVPGLNGLGNKDFTSFYDEKLPDGTLVRRHFNGIGEDVGYEVKIDPGMLARHREYIEACRQAKGRGIFNGVKGAQDTQMGREAEITHSIPQGVLWHWAALRGIDPEMAQVEIDEDADKFLDLMKFYGDLCNTGRLSFEEVRG